MPYGLGDLIQNENFSILINKITGIPIPENTPIYWSFAGSEFILGGHFEFGSPRQGIDFHEYEYDTPF